MGRCLWNQLIREEDDYDLVIQTNISCEIFTMDELLKIAESLTP
jgi:hypothetical protein